MEKETRTEVVQKYTRKQAIDDGNLIDVSKSAKDAGFRFPMAVTIAVWERCIEVDRDYDGEQDEGSRLWDVLNMLHYTLLLAGDRNPTFFTALVQTDADAFEEVRLKAHCGPGDDYQPVLTIKMAEED